MKLARWIYRIAGIYGLIVLVPQFFLERYTGEQHPPAITHPEFFYGFVGVGVAWQVAFLLIAADPVRYRPLMPLTWIEKGSFLIATVWLFATGRIQANMLAAGMIDGLLGVAFVVAFVSSRPAAHAPAN